MRPELAAFRLFEHHVSVNGRAGLLRLCGEVDLSAKKALERRIDELPLDRIEELVLDLREITFIDSTGLRLLLECRSRCSENGVDLVLLAPPEDVRRLFAIAGLKDLFPMIEGVPAASSASQS